MLCIVAWAIAHCNVCIDPKNPKFTEKPAISDLIFITKYFPHYSSDDCNRFIKVKVLRKLALICFFKGKLPKIAF